MIRLLLADDHALFREGLKHLLSLTNDIAVVSEAADGAQVLDALQLISCDLVLLDMTMPGIAGAELISRILAMHPGQPILMLSMHNDPLVIRKALGAGAKGYLTKDSDPSVLLAGIRRVAGGGRYIDPALAEVLAFDVCDVNGSQRHKLLSAREYQILSQLAQGKAVRRIAEELSVSEKTVSTHKKNIMKKMGFTNGIDLIRYALDAQLLY